MELNKLKKKLSIKILNKILIYLKTNSRIFFGLQNLLFGRISYQTGHRKLQRDELKLFWRLRWPS